MQDLRLFNSWFGYFSIYKNAANFSYNKLARSAIQKTNICRNCLDKRKKVIRMFRQSNEGSWKCPHCEGNAPVISHFSIRHIKNKKTQVEEKAQDVVESVPRFREFIKTFDTWTSEEIRDFQNRFERYALEAEKGTLLTTKRYFWGHYDITKKCKRKWCSLTAEQVQKAKPTVVSPTRY